MLIFYLLVRLLAEDGHCKEYKGILDRYQGLLNDHEQCVRTIGDNQATIRSYENLIVHGLQQQIETLKMSQVTLNERVSAKDPKKLEHSLSAVVSEQEEIKKSVADMKTRVSKVEDIEDHSRKLEEKVKNLAEKIDALEKAKVSRNENVSSYFSATSHTETTSTGTPIPLPVIISEHQSGFNGNTGIMTVKIPGVYFWNCAFMTWGLSTHIRLMHKDGKHLRQIHRSHNSQNSGHHMIPVTATLVLKKGDQVWLELTQGRLYSNGERYHQCTAFKTA